ncbi:MAG: transketolase [Prevotella sp.]|nr:transketolase [Prevotella sp.]
MDNKVNVKLLSMAGQGGSIFGISLMNMMKERDDLMVLSSDMSTPAGLDKFKATYPDHFLNVGIAEQNMIGIAAGLTDEGYRAVCVAQACFITMRSFEQVRQYCGYMKTPLILVGIGSGLSLQYMGNTHYAIEDIALMRTIPGMTVIAPCDSLEAIKAFDFAIHHDGPVYIRLFGGTSIPSVYNEDYNFIAGKSVSFREGNDIDLIATGSMVGVAIKIADALLEDGVSASVINMHTIKPIDVSFINSDKKLIVTLEEHSIIGGLGDAIISYSDHKHKVLKIAINDRYVPVGSYPYMLEQCGITVEQIKNQIINQL